jgi:hypothetical protein
MGILLIAFLAFALLVVGSAWKRLRSNWRSIQSMRSDYEGAADVVLDIDIPEGSGAHSHHGHGHDGMHHGADAAGHDVGGFDSGHGGFDGGGGHH